MSSPPPTPTLARITSLHHWDTFFHPITGLFRLPNTAGRPIQHLDIDLRYVNHKYERDHKGDSADKGDSGLAIHTSGEVYLPNVCIVTLRGAEHVHDSEERMDCLAEVLLAVKPIEVRWLNASNDPSEQITFSTHLVHPAIIAAGEIWAREGGARKVVIQGGFPCPNLTAPTPYSLTPAATPCPSPGPGKTSFGAASLSALPALSLTKPKGTNEDHKPKERTERTERKRLAEYSLKPRFEFAMGSWGAEHIEWRFDGRYTPACIRASIEHLLKALNKSFPYASNSVDSRLPSLLTFAPLPPTAINSIRELVEQLSLDPELVAYLCDVVFFATTLESTHYARLFDATTQPTEACQSARLKAEMLLLTSDAEITIDSAPITAVEPMTSMTSMSDSAGSLISGGGADGSTDDDDDEVEATTPDMGVSVIIHQEGQKEQSDQAMGSVSPSLVI